MKLVNFLAMAALAYVIIWIYRDLREQLRSKDAENHPKTTNKPKASAKAYKTLGLAPEATLKEINAAYEELKRQHR